MEVEPRIELGQSHQPQCPTSPFQREKLGQYLLRFINRLKTSGKSMHTLAAYRNDLSLFCEFLIEKKYEPHSFGVNLQEEWEWHMRNNGRKSGASIRRGQMSVRTFMHFLVAEKIIAASPILEQKSPRQPSHELMHLLNSQYKTLCTVLEDKAHHGDEKAIRDIVILRILAECGLKVTEAARLLWKDVSFSGQTKGTVVVEEDKIRLIPFSQDLTRCLIRLRALRTTLQLGISQNNALFFGYLNVSRRTRTASLHRHGIKFVVYEVCQEILGVAYNAESLRNHAIVKWLDQGLSLEQVAELAGYSSLHSLNRFSKAGADMRLPKRKTKHQTEGS